MNEPILTRYKPIFSGSKSEDFWQELNSLKKEEIREMFYTFGCKCQELETIIKKLEKRIAQLEIEQ